MKNILKYIAMFLIALVLGIGSAAVSLKRIAETQSIKNGQWNTNMSLGTENLDPYTKTAVALFAILALDKSEAVYFISIRDDEGHYYNSECDYQLEGNDIAGRWWSITAYGADQFLIPNEFNRYSYNQMNVAREPDNSYKIHLSSTKKEGNWLPTGQIGRFTLAIRIYNPDKSVYENPGSIKLPRVFKEGCK